MSKKDVKDPNAVIVIRRLLEIVDLGMVEDLQQVEESLNVSTNLELAGNFCTKKGKNFFSRSSDKINKILHKTSITPIFSQSLTEAGIDRISVLIDNLKKHVASDGIFRISGNKKRQDELKQLLDKDIEIDFEEDDTFTEHDMASILKQFLAELPEPIIIHAHIDVHMKIIDLDNTEKQITALQLLFLLLPPPNRHLLQQLLRLLHEVADNKENRMSAFNLAVVFAPSIMLYKHKSSSCLSAVPEDIMTFTACLAFMIENEKSIFTVPDDLLQEIEDSKLLGNTQDGAMLVKSKSFCTQVDSRLFHTVGNKNTANALVDLYARISEMEDNPKKREYLKRFAEFYPGTPPFKPKSRKPAAEVAPAKTTFTTPRIRSPRFRSFSGRFPLHAMSNSATRNDANTLCDSPTGSFRSFQTPVLDCRSKSKTTLEPCGNNEELQVPATPSGHFFKFTPSRTGSIRNPFKKKRRTRTIGSPNETTSSNFTKPFSPKPRRTSSSSQIEKPLSVQLSSSTAVKRTKNTSATPVMKKSLVGRDIRNLYSTPMNSKSRQVFSSAAK